MEHINILILVANIIIVCLNTVGLILQVKNHEATTKLEVIENSHFEKLQDKLFEKWFQLNMKLIDLEKRLGEKLTAQEQTKKSE